MKQYATLFIRDNCYELLDENGAMLLKGGIPKIYYAWENPKVFNILSTKGWDIEYKYEDCSWYMMSKVVE